MTVSVSFRSVFLAGALLVGLWSTAPAAVACSLVKFGNDGQYVGGDLVSQIARKADTIQIVTVTERYLMHRSYSLGGWFLDEGNTDLPAYLPEYIDQFAFALGVVETLKMEADPTYFIYNTNLRVQGYAPDVFGPQTAPQTGGWSHPNRLPAWMLERPGDDGYAFSIADAGAGLGGGECSMPYVLEKGQQFVALRDSLGRLYPASGGFPLEIDTVFRTERGGRERLSLNMQSLIPISGPDDPLVEALRRAIAADG